MLFEREAIVSNNLTSHTPAESGKPFATQPVSYPPPASQPEAGSRLPVFARTQAGLAWKDRELNLLWQRFSAALAAMDVGRQHWPLDGWLQLDAEAQPPFPVILVQFNADGVGVVLGMEHPMPPGQLGELTTQAHGAGCRHRPVRCQGRVAYFRTLMLQYAALGFDPEG